MQELISKEAVKEVFKTAIELPWARLYFHDAIEALPTTVHHEYKVGEEYEFSKSETVGSVSVKFIQFMF